MFYAFSHIRDENGNLLVVRDTEIAKHRKQYPALLAPWAEVLVWKAKLTDMIKLETKGNA